MLNAVRRLSKYQVISIAIVFIGLSIFLVGAIFSSYALEEPVGSISFTSQSLNYQDKTPGSFKITKSASWLEKGTARVTFDINTILNINEQDTDLLLVLDTTISLEKEKFTQLKESVNEVANSVLSNTNNQIGLITFAKDATILSDFTNNKEELTSMITSLEHYESVQNTGDTSYYQAFLKVGDILKNYEHQSTRKCIVVFITDGLPNVDIPNQEGEYKYLKSRYPYLTVHGIQYEMNNKNNGFYQEAVEPIIKVSDQQFVSTKENLTEVLYQASVIPISYEELVITDFINTKYFDIKSLANIDASFGEAKIERENGEVQVVWNLNGLKTGLQASLTIDITLRNEYANISGFYETNQKERVSYKIGSVEEQIEKVETPILSSHYEVSYDLNLPSGCQFETVPETTSQIVRETVEISDLKPSCENYEFQGWKITTEDTWQMNEDYFSMPEHDVLLRAEWSKLSITKAMEGEVHIVYPPIMQSVGYNYNKEFWGYKDKITKFVFQNEIKDINNTKETYDISAEKNESVIGKLVTNEENVNTYTAYIQGEGGVIANENCANLFDSFSKLESFEGLEYFDTSNVKTMDGMFAKCPALKSLDLSVLDTSNVEIMSFMFLRDTALTDLNLSDLNTKKVTDMKHMFRECSALENLSISHFDTSKVTNMTYMFNNCNSLLSLDLSSFDTSQVTDMAYMFTNCRGLSNLDLSNFQTQKVTNMSYMFQGCSELESLNIDSFNTPLTRNMSYMFESCKKVQTINTSNFDTSIVTNMSYMFNECNKLSTIDVSSFNTSQVTDMRYMFNACNDLTTLDVSNFDTSNVANVKFMFGACKKLSAIDVSNFNTTKVTDMTGMFDYCQMMTSLDLSAFNTSKVTSMESMFRGCTALETLDISSFDTTLVKLMDWMFQLCQKLEGLDLSHFNTANVTNMAGMFNLCKGLKSLNVSSFRTPKVTNMKNMFDGCYLVTELDVSNFDTSQVEQMDNMFAGCHTITELNVSSFNTTKARNMQNMFGSCWELQALDVSNFDTSNVTNMAGMFQVCRKIESLNLKDFNTTKVADMNSMFEGCQALKSLNVSNFNTSMVTDFSEMFFNCWLLAEVNLDSFTFPKASNLSSMFESARSIKTTIRIDSLTPINYTKMFQDAALTSNNAQIIVDCTAATSNLVDRMILTKSATSNVSKEGSSTDPTETGLFSNYYPAAQAKLDEMTLDEKIAQLLFVHYPGANTATILNQYQFGGLLFFADAFTGKTAEQVRSMMSNAQSAVDIPLLIGVDEEGGKVVRVSSNTNLAPEKFKSPQELYSSGGFPTIRQDTINKSNFLYDLGINLNFAPVVDVSTNSSDYMYSRSLGQGPELTSTYATTVIEASKGLNVSYTLKHFPGYGNNADTHVGGSTDTRTYDYIKENDLPPFRAGIAAGAECVLISHNIVTAIDPDNPASISPAIHNLLRGELEFTGVIITDDLGMKAVSTIDNVFVKALVAGNDFIMTSNYSGAITQINNALANGTINEEFINQKVLRILAWKYYKGML